jgi:polysaccharide export outer membrane protein
MRLRTLSVFFLLALALAGCARPLARYAAAPATAYSELDMRMYGAPQRSSYVPKPQSYAVQRASQVLPVREAIDEGAYTLDTGDKLRIVVFGQDALSNTYIVNPEGQVSLPLVGNVGARGMTAEQLAGAIAGRLKQSYLRDPSVAVEVEVYRPFFVLGEVTFPGQYPFVPNMTIENAVAVAGGFTPRAYKDKVAITRKVAGVPSRIALPLRHPLRPGDTVEVGERWF